MAPSVTSPAALFIFRSNNFTSPPIAAYLAPIISATKTSSSPHLDIALISGDFSLSFLFSESISTLGGKNLRVLALAANLLFGVIGLTPSINGRGTPK